MIYSGKHNRAAKSFDNGIFNVERDFVYTPADDDGSVESVHVSIAVGAERLYLEISSQIHVGRRDLEDVIAVLSRSFLKKLKIDVFNDCDVYFIEHDKRFHVKFAEREVRIGALEPMRSLHPEIMLI